MKIFILTSIFLLSASILAIQDDINLKAGITYAKVDLAANQNSKDNFGAIGFNTHFSYQWTSLELSLSSYFYWGGFQNLQFDARNERIIGDGSYRNVSVAPIIKYHFNKLQPVKNWHLYSGVGPTWGLQSIQFERFSSSGSLFNIEQKLTYESFGGVLVLGIEETPINEDIKHPFFAELSFGMKNSYEVSVVDKSDFVNVKTLSKEEKSNDFKDRYIAISVGLTLF